MNCPQCKKLNPPTARYCNCGFLFDAAHNTGATLSYQPHPNTNEITATVVQNNIHADRILCDQDECRIQQPPITAPKTATYCSYCTRILPLPAGTILGQDRRWRIEANLSNGKAGMSRVYLASDMTRNAQKVVVKELLDEQNRPMAEKQIYTDHLRNEAEVLGKLGQLRSVPTLIQSYTLFGPRHFFVMEYIDGEDVDTLVKQGRLDFDTVIRFAISTCDVLSIIHNFKPPIVHRDIKPENLRLGRDGILRLMDFGIARTMRVNTTLTQGVGTRGYVAPEQHAGSAETRSDLYSLSATMFYMLGRQVPDSSNYRQPGGLRRLNNQVSSELEEVILANLCFDPNDRYSTAEEFKQDLISGHQTKFVKGYACGHLNKRLNIYCEEDGLPVRAEMRECRKPECRKLYPLRGRFCPKCGHPANEPI